MQRQLRLGDILDDYCPRERRLTNHAIVAMVGDDVKQTRCTTCDADHEYKHARVPRQRRKDTTAALHAQVLAGIAPKRVVPDVARPMVTTEPAASSVPPPSAPAAPRRDDDIARVAAALGLASRMGHVSGPAISRGREGLARKGHDEMDRDEESVATRAGEDSDLGELVDAEEQGDGDDESLAATPGGRPEGPAHRRLIRATLPRLEGQPPAARPAPDFTIRTPNTGRPNRFRPRQQARGAAQGFTGNRTTGQNGNGNRAGGPRHGHSNGNNQPRHSQGAPQARRFDNRNNKRSK